MYKSLRDVRYHNGELTQEEMARRIGISKGAYSLIEQGKRVGSIKTWVKIQELFGLSDNEVWVLQKNNYSQVETRPLNYVGAIEVRN